MPLRPPSGALVAVPLASLLTAAAVAQGLEVLVIDPPARLGESGATAVLRGSLPGVNVVPTGAGELVVSGPPGLVARARQLMAELDRPPREIVVELLRHGGGTQLGSESSLVLNSGSRKVPSTLRSTTGTTRASASQSIRIREGTSASLFVGDEVPYRGGGPFAETRFVSAGKALRLRLVRVDPGRGALLEVEGEDGGLGAPGPAGPSIRRERVGAQTYAPFDTPVALASFQQDEGGSLGDTFVEGEIVVEEQRGPLGRRQVTRRPVDGSLGGGRTRTRTTGGGVYTVIVRELPAAEPGRTGLPSR